MHQLQPCLPGQHALESMTQDQFRGRWYYICRNCGVTVVVDQEVLDKKIDIWKKENEV